MTHRQTTMSQPTWQPHAAFQTTLLDLVWAINREATDERQVVTTVAQLVNSGQAQLTGAFKNTRLIVG